MNENYFGITFYGNFFFSESFSELGACYIGKTTKVRLGNKFYVELVNDYGIDGMYVWQEVDF